MERACLKQCVRIESCTCEGEGEAFAPATTSVDAPSLVPTAVDLTSSRHPAETRTPIGWETFKTEGGVVPARPFVPVAILWPPSEQGGRFTQEGWTNVLTDSVAWREPQRPAWAEAASDTPLACASRVRAAADRYCADGRFSLDALPGRVAQPRLFWCVSRLIEAAERYAVVACLCYKTIDTPTTSLNHAGTLHADKATLESCTRLSKGVAGSTKGDPKPDVPSSFLADLLFVALCFFCLWAVFTAWLPEQGTTRHQPPSIGLAEWAKATTLYSPVEPAPMGDSCARASESTLQSIWQTSFIAEPYHPVMVTPGNLVSRASASSS